MKISIKNRHKIQNKNIQQHMHGMSAASSYSGAIGVDTSGV